MSDERQTPSPGEELVSSGYALLRQEHDSIQRVAIERPRDEDRALARALADLDKAPELASRIYYSLPFKDHEMGCDTWERRKNCNCPMHYVRGLSIKGATNLAMRWGNCAATVRFVAQDDDSIHLVGVFHDFESAALFETPKIVSKYRHKKGGGRYKMRDDDLDKLIAGVASRAKRNAISDGLPDYVTEKYYRRARAIAVRLEREEAEAKLVNPEKMSPEEKEAALCEKILQTFGQLGATQAMVEKYLGHSMSEGLTDDEVADLRGIRNAINDGERSVEAVFLEPDFGNEPRTTHADDDPAELPPESAAAKALGSQTVATGGRLIGEAPASDTEPREQSELKLVPDPGAGEETRESVESEATEANAPAAEPAGDVDLSNAEPQDLGF